MTKKLQSKKAEFAQPPLLSTLPNPVKVGAGVGAGLGLLQGAGIFESDAEKKATNVGNRLGKVITGTTVGSGLGAGAGYGFNRYKTTVIEPQRREAIVREYESANPRGVRKAVKVIKDTGKAVGDEIQSVKQEVQKVVSPTLEQREAMMNDELQKKASGENKPSLMDWVKSKAEEGVKQRKSILGFNKMIRKSANFQDPATIQRLIQKGSTYIPPKNDGVVTLESTLRGKIKKKKADQPSSMSVKEIKSMIESGRPVGNYFNKKIRKSANFLISQKRNAEFSIADQINNGLISAGRLITQPTAKVVRKAATKAGGGNLSSLTANRFVANLPFGMADKINYGSAKAAVGTHDALNSVAKVLDTDKAAKYAAIGVGGTALAGGGLLAAKMKKEDESRYGKSIRKSASFGIIPAGLVSGAQKAAAGTAKRFASTSPLINAANVGTAVGAGLGALEGSGINETEEQRRSTGLVGRAGKVLGMTGLGAGVGRGLGSAAGYGIDKYQTSQKWNARNKSRDAKNMPSSKDSPTKIEIQD